MNITEHDIHAELEIDNEWFNFYIVYSCIPEQGGARYGHPDNWSEYIPAEIELTQVKKEVGYDRWEDIEDLDNLSHADSELYEKIITEITKDRRDYDEI